MFLRHVTARSTITITMRPFSRKKTHWTNAHPPFSKLHDVFTFLHKYHLSYIRWKLSRCINFYSLVSSILSLVKIIILLYKVSLVSPPTTPIMVIHLEIRNFLTDHWSMLNCVGKLVFLTVTCINSSIKFAYYILHTLHLNHLL